MNVWNLIMLKLKAAYEILNAAYTAHIANASAHHSKYTDAESVTAVAAEDYYLRKDQSDTIIINDLTIDNKENIHLNWSGIELAGTFHQPSLWINSKHATNNTKCTFLTGSRFFWMIWRATAHTELFRVCDVTSVYPEYGTRTNHFEVTTTKINLFDHIIKDPKNYVHSGLSGTKKLVEIDIDGNSYYFEVYPTKA